MMNYNKNMPQFYMHPPNSYHITNILHTHQASYELDRGRKAMKRIKNEIFAAIFLAIFFLAG